MDRSGKPGHGPDPENLSWLGDDVSSDDPGGATGIFGPQQPASSVNTVLAAKKGPDTPSEHQEISSPSSPQVPVQRGRDALQEPVVHKVVLGGSATQPINVLEAMRSQKSPNSFQTADPLATPPSEGFTQILRAISGEPSPSSASSFQTETRPAESVRDGVSKQVTDPASPGGEGLGGFTSLLQGFSGTGIASSTSTSAPHTEQSDTTTRATPGTFTQLFDSLNSEPSNLVNVERIPPKPRAANSPSPSQYQREDAVPFRPEVRKDPPVANDWLAQVDQSALAPPSPDNSLTMILERLDRPVSEPVGSRTIQVSDVPPVPSPSTSPFTDTYRGLNLGEERAAPAPNSATPVQPSPTLQPPPVFHPSIPIPPAQSIHTPAPQWPQAAPLPQSVAPIPQATAPPAQPTPVPAMGKMQQYLPLLLMIIIFLLVVILITMVFMLKQK
jgi:hypothetical protein